MGGRTNCTGPREGAARLQDQEHGNQVVPGQSKFLFSFVRRASTFILGFVLSFQGLGKEVESQLLLIENLGQRIATISSDLDPEQLTQLENDFKALGAEYSTLCGAVKECERDLDKAVAERQNFEATLDEIQRKLKSFATQSKENEYLPLASSDVEKIAEKLKVRTGTNLCILFTFQLIGIFLLGHRHSGKW